MPRMNLVRFEAVQLPEKAEPHIKSLGDDRQTVSRFDRILKLFLNGFVVVRFIFSGFKQVEYHAGCDGAAFQSVEFFKIIDVKIIPTGNAPEGLSLLDHMARRRFLGLVGCTDFEPLSGIDPVSGKVIEASKGRYGDARLDSDFRESVAAFDPVMLKKRFGLNQKALPLKDFVVPEFIPLFQLFY